MNRFRRQIGRLVRIGFVRSSFEVALSILIFYASVLVFNPVIGTPTRLLILPLIVYWGLRRGMIGGFVSAVASYAMVIPLITKWAGLVPVPPDAAAFLLCLFACLGAIIGRMSDLSRQLRRELAVREEVEVRLREEQSTFRVFFENNPHPMWIFEAESLRFLLVNRAMADLYGYSIEELGTMTLKDLQLPENLAMLRNVVDSLHSYDNQIVSLERQHRRKDGMTIIVEIVSQRINTREGPARLCLANDVTEQRRTRDSLEYQANHDALTGLPNRACFHKSLALAVAEAPMSTPFAIFLLDLDRFKEINDRLGHLYGDLVLQQIGPRLRGELRPQDILARLGGDEFGILLPGADASESRRIGERLLASLERPFLFEGRSFDIGASIGIAIQAEQPRFDAGTLLHMADVAMYAAKRDRIGVVLYGPHLETASPPPTNPAPEPCRGMEGRRMIPNPPSLGDRRTVRNPGAKNRAR